MNQLIEHIIKDAQFEKGAIDIVLKADKPYYLLIDSKLIDRAIENIVRNVIHYVGDNGHIQITLEASNVMQKIIIEDNGPGVDEQMLQYIFQPFYSEKKPHANGKGYGLGLAIANECVLLHQGSITAENRKEGGLRIVITLPKA